MTIDDRDLSPRPYETGFAAASRPARSLADDLREDAAHLDHRYRREGREQGAGHPALRSRGQIDRRGEVVRGVGKGVG